MSERSFDILMIIGRGGCGKSELIDHLKGVENEERLAKYHIGAFDELDDFPWLLQLFEDEDLWEKLGHPRRWSRHIGKLYEATDDAVYNFLILKFNRAVQRLLGDDPDRFRSRTLFLEFARGGPCSYRTALALFEPEVLSRTAIVYLDNTFEESLRRNEIRSPGEGAEQTILFHKVPVEVMERLYKTHDWAEFTGGRPEGLLEVDGMQVPFATIWNMPETSDPGVLEKRYGPPLEDLWERCRARGARA